MGYYISVAIFLVICASVNYYLDFEDSIIDSYYGNPIRMFYFFLFFGFAYYGTTLILVVSKSRWDILKNKWFWIKSLLILSVLGIDSGIHYHHELVSSYMAPPTHYFGRKVAANVINVMTFIIPLWVFYRLYDKKVGSFYGLTVRGFDYKTYGFMLLVMIPLIVIASFIDNFNDFYPIYRANPAHEHWGVAEWIPAMVYETAYGWNFLTVELTFRGFMILAMAGIMGRNAVMPMVSVYCFYHFGKPEGEAISSIFGGYILGVISLESKSIFGGVMIHVGIAWLMEFFAWCQNSVFK